MNARLEIGFGGLTYYFSVAEENGSPFAVSDPCLVTSEPRKPREAPTCREAATPTRTCPTARRPFPFASGLLPTGYRSCS